MRKYRLVAKKGEGTFSEVLKAQNIKNGNYHAIKCMKNRFENIDQVNNLREIQALRRLSPHEHVITLEEVLYDQPTGRLALVFELMDGNLYEIIRGRKHYLNPQLIKGYMWQLMKSLDHMHKKGIFHRDIKPENILTDNGCEVGYGLKLADFGSCRGIYSKQPYTEYISTRWYRAPECLLTDGYYGPEMDMWGAGCVMFEITTLFPLFPGKNETDQIARIHKIIGTKADTIAKLKEKGASHINFDFPAEKGTGIVEHLQHCSPEAVDLMLRLLKYDAAERITARDAMRHPYFKEMREFEVRKQAALQASAQVATTEPNVNAQSSPSHQHQPQPPKQKHVSPEHGSHASQQLQLQLQMQQQQQQQLQLQQQQQLQLQQQQQLQLQQATKQQKQANLAPIQGQAHGHAYNKALPNIIYSDHPSNSNQNQTLSTNKNAKHAHHTTGPTMNVNANGNSMMAHNGIIGVNTTGGTTNSTNMSSLPPILGGGVHGNSNSYTKTNKSNAGGASGTQKRRKKYRLNYANQEKNSARDPSQVLKAYGVPSSNNNSSMNYNANAKYSSKR